MPVSRQAVTFSDSASISANAKAAVKAVQQTGVIASKTGKLFAPQDNVTRGEAAAILRRFAELSIDEGTARGWVQNDSGEWQHINENGKAVTGWQTIDGSRYFFDANGVMKTGWHTESMNTYYLDANGVMASGKWVQIGDKWYYFHANGRLAVNTVIDGYTVGADGARQED